MSEIEEIKENDIFPIDPNLLEAHEENTKVYGNELDMELVKSIEEIGQLDPIVVTKIKESDNYQIISGHRRWNAIKEIKKEKNKEIKAICVYKKFKEDYQLLEALIEFNRQRKKVPIVIWRESKLLDKIYVEKAKINSEKNLIQYSTEVTNSSPRENNGKTIVNECKKLEVRENYLSKIKKIGRLTEHKDPKIRQIASDIMDETGKIGEPEGVLTVDAALKKLKIYIAAETGKKLEDLDKEKTEKADELKDYSLKLKNEIVKGKSPNSVYGRFTGFVDDLNKDVEIEKYSLGNYTVIVADPADVKKAKSYILTEAENAALFLYSSSKDLKSKIELLEKWEFKLHGMVIFKIENTPSHYLNNEFLIVLLGIKGNIENYQDEKPNALISLKSDKDFKGSIVYKMAEQMFPNQTYADPFRDPKRKGWNYLKTEDNDDPDYNHCLHDITSRE